jgi:hypothetical protein
VVEVTVEAAVVAEEVVTRLMLAAGTGLTAAATRHTLEVAATRAMEDTVEVMAVTAMDAATEATDGDMAMAEDTAMVVGVTAAGEAMATVATGLITGRTITTILPTTTAMVTTASTQAPTTLHFQEFTSTRELHRDPVRLRYP